MALAMALAGCATVKAPAPPRAVQVAPGVYMVQGAAGEIGPANLGRVGNAGFIVGDTGVIAIDTGTSYRHGQALLQAIAAVTDRPVRAAIVTHTRQEFLFGAVAFRERGIALHMHRKAAELMAARCETCLKTLKRLLGDDEMRGTAMWKPDATFESAHALPDIGRAVRVLSFGHSSGPGDVAVLDERTGTLFAGGLVDQGRIPDVQDSDLQGWRAALAALRELRPQRIVPGHGPLTTQAAIGSTERYLAQLQSRLLELLDAGAALSEVADKTVLAEFSRWDQYDTIHRRNASVLFVRFERELLFK
jgi:glyoxylase-like metal-dependent hydrolase (beta-lactamase superfamily II)